MKRRQFLTLAGAALASAGLPLTLLKEKPTPIPLGYMREVQQYMISDDDVLWRYDVVAVNLSGNETQCFVELRERADRPLPLDARREAARFGLGHFLKREGLSAVSPHASKQFRMALPRAIPGAYV